MAKVPYIPLYIGDWEQDTNCLSLQAEAAWLKVIIKMFKDQKSGIYKTSTKALQNLWRCSDFEVQEIIQEFKENNICDFGAVPENDKTIVFMNRRMLKDIEISKVRTKAVQKRYKTPTKEDTKPLQNTEYDNENEIEFENNTETEVQLKNEAAKNLLIPSMFSVWVKSVPDYMASQKDDYAALGAIAQFICEQLKVSYQPQENEVKEVVLAMWGKITEWVKEDGFYKSFSLKSINNNIQTIAQKQRAKNSDNETNRTTPKRGSKTAGATNLLNSFLDELAAERSNT